MSEPAEDSTNTDPVSTESQDTLSTNVPNVDARPAAVPEADIRKSASREVPASTIVHLMGLATSKELGVLEAKIDVLTSRIAAVTSKLDRLGGQLNSVFDDLSLERVESQLAEIRLALKKTFPKALGGDESGAVDPAGK